VILAEAYRTAQKTKGDHWPVKVLRLSRISRGGYTGLVSVVCRRSVLSWLGLNAGHPMLSCYQSARGALCHYRREFSSKRHGPKYITVYRLFNRDEGRDLLMIGIVIW